MYNLKEKQAQYSAELEAMKNKYAEVKNFLAQLELEIIRKDAIIVEFEALMREEVVTEGVETTEPLVDSATENAKPESDDKVLEEV